MARTDAALANKDAAPEWKKTSRPLSGCASLLFPNPPAKD